MRSIAVRLAVAFGLTALVVFSLTGIALYYALAETLGRQIDEDLHGKLEVAERLVGSVRTIERWDELRNTLATITTTDGNTRFWIACADSSLNYGSQFPHSSHPPTDGKVRILRLKDHPYAMKTLSSTLRPLIEIPEVHLVVGVSTGPMYKTLNAFAVALTAITLAGIAIVSLLGFRFARYGLKPLIDLSTGAQSLNPKNLSQRLALGSKVSELVPLANSFNGALDRLEAAYVQLESFSADVAHELRTPLGNIIGMAQVALTRERSESELRETLASALEELERLSAIVTDMLFLARVEQGEALHNLESVSLAAEVYKTIEFLEPLIEEKSLSVHTVGDAVIPVDKALFRRAMSNLLHNAIQYSAAGARLQVEMHQSQDECVIAVSNPGDQIGEESLPRLFDRFYRADPSRVFSAGNHGLGLAIVKAIATIHKGKVFARSGGGINTFGLTFWAGQPMPAHSSVSGFQ
ncbi:heavy metal sensor histidine kinase [Janthinobacterium sp. 17J80-10]|uniref:heavy metal sensor histidine kinase n=1 Tax=Janthinobacterium sp. 17J80-10 TaxID=2497863 RepID=UPI0010059BC2|nr:heavy metal sensor histidine kinase [Janthinobacterium sp. 17J80-10]QAU33101.1 HAMP domain-containing protein [Janthinobacterium sp. 17J80-10]